MTSTATARNQVLTEAKKNVRTGGPIDPSPYSIVMTLSGAILAICLAIQATDQMGRMLSWAAIIGHFALGMTMMLSIRHKAEGNGGSILRHAWTIGVVVVGICEFLAMMVVWGGQHL